MLPAVQETVFWHRTDMKQGAPNDLLSVKNIGMRKYVSPTQINSADEKLD